MEINRTERETSLDIVKFSLVEGSEQCNVQVEKDEDTEIMIAIQNEAQNGIPDDENRQGTTYDAVPNEESPTTIQNPPIIPQNIIETSRDSEFTPTAVPLLENNDSS